MTNNSLKSFVKHQISEGRPLVIWRMPNEQTTYLLICQKKIQELSAINFDELPSGFVFSPFNQEQGSLFFSGEKVYSIKDGILELEDNNIPILKDEPSNISDFQFIDTDDQKDTYLKLIDKAKIEIDHSELEKVVLSRRKNVGEIEIKNSFQIFEKLEKAYPSAFVSLVFLPDANQVWICATPEILVSQNKEGEFCTMALAGTQSAVLTDGSIISPKEALWSQKEIEEQAMVSRYIINCLKKIRVREFTEKGPKTFQAGNLLHLSTLFSIDTKEIEYPNLSTVMLNLLHPTSAVCGMPKEIALDFIEKYEGYDREFYSGFLGPVNFKETSSLFVNLRTMKIEENEVYLYAGGGITSDSVPEKEFNETVIKMNTILNVLKN